MPSAPVRERVCTVCPPWVPRCAHLDGRAVMLTDERRAGAHWRGRSPPHQWAVTWGVVALCPNCDAEHHGTDERSGGFTWCDSRTDADAEFVRRAEAMRLGEEEG